MKTLGLSLTFVSTLLLLILILLLNLGPSPAPTPSLTPFLQFLLPESLQASSFQQSPGSPYLWKRSSPWTTVLGMNRTL